LTPAALASALGDGAVLGELISRLEPNAARRLLDEIAQGLQDGSKARVAQRALIDRLNQRRPHRAQRLFTSLFEPFLSDDLALLSAPVAVPGLLTRPDVAALWTILSRTALTKLVPAVSAELDEAAREQLIDDVIASRLGQSRRGEMQRMALMFLGNALARGDSARDLLQQLNQSRQGLFHAQPPYFGPYPIGGLIRPLEKAELRALHDLLARDPGLVAGVGRALAVADRLAATDEAPELAHAIEEAETAAAGSLGPERDALALWVPMVVLHARRRYAATAFYLARRAGEPGMPTVGEALLGHYSTCVQGLVIGLTEALPDKGEGALTITGRAQDFLDDLLDQYQAILGALQVSGLADSQDRKLAALFRAPWTSLENFVTGRLCPTLVRRVEAMGAQPRFPAPDHATVAWACRWAWRWKLLLEEFGFLSREVANWRDVVGDHLDRGMALASRDDAIKGGTPDQVERLRLAQLGRLRQLYQALDLDTTRGLSVISRGQWRTCRAAVERQLTEGVMPDPDERAIVTAMVTLIRAEVKKTQRTWVNAELSEFVDRAKSAGY
jgi:hypothetical protein